MGIEFWTSMPAMPGQSSRFGSLAQADGWDGLLMVDSQNLSGDPYVCLAMAGIATDTLGVQTSVTNPVTRHPAVTASSAITVQKLTNGRMIIGIGRGDSALAYLGRAPAKVKWFERYLVNLQAYLRGDEVPFDATGISDDIAPPVSSLGLADAPSASAIHWAPNTPKVPVEVAATGEKVIGLAARHADRIMFALGADPKRLKWGIETARAAADTAGKDPDGLSFGAYVNVVCHEDLEIGRNLGRAGTSLFARFSAMHGSVSGPADDHQNEVLKNVHASYDMNKHARTGSEQSKKLTDDFMDGYAILGGVDDCVTRIQELKSMGITKFAVSGPNFSAKDPDAQHADRQFTKEVIPQCRG